MISLITNIKRKPNLLTQSIHNVFILIDPDEDNYFELNETAEVIWRFLWKKRTVSEIINKIISVYKAESKKAISNEIIKFIDNTTNKIFIISS